MKTKAGSQKLRWEILEEKKKWHTFIKTRKIVIKNRKMEETILKIKAEKVKLDTNKLLTGGKKLVKMAFGQGKKKKNNFESNILIKFKMLTRA